VFSENRHSIPVEASLRARERFATFCVSLLALAPLSIVGCTAETPQPTGVAEQPVINPPLPSDLNLILNAKTTVTIGALAHVDGDVGSVGLNGSVLFDVSSSQFCCGGGNVLANTVTVNTNATVGHVFGNDITVNGFASQKSLGLDPTAMPQVPAVTPATPGTTNVSVAANQAKQLCPGQYGAISLGANSTLNLNGGVYQVTRLTLADGARLEPSEPVVILVSGGMTTGFDAFVLPSAQSINPMTAADIRIEVGTSVTIGDRTQVRAHLLAPNGKLTTGKNTLLTGAAWAKTIVIGPQSSVDGEGVFSARAPSVPPPCNDNNTCTVDTCVGSGTAAFCRNTPVPTGTSCEDGNTCNGAERCDAVGQCQPAAPATVGTSCTDGNACNGDETCDGSGTCVPGTPPVVSDGNACTADSCDPAAGVSHVSVPDGTTCSGVGTCEAGTCSVKGTVFSENFIQFQSAPAQCDSWNNFLGNQLVDGSYGSVSLSGSFDTTGVTCSDPAAATQICQALHHGSFASVSCGGHTWNIGQCGGTELSVDFSVCFCTSGGSPDVRPCTGAEWGGVNTETCDAPSQNITVVCE
jgi:slime mold repeat-containing protein